MTFYYLNALGMWEYNERNFDKVLMQACVKISYLLYNAHQLLLRGEYGVANILLRQVFEYLVIGKYFYKQHKVTSHNKESQVLQIHHIIRH